MHASSLVDGDGDHGVGAEAADLGCLLETVVAVGGSEEDEPLVAVALSLGLREEVVPGDDDRTEVSSTSTRLAHATGVRALEAVELCHLARGLLLDQRQRWRDWVDVQVGVQRREQQVCGQADGRGGGVELVKEALVPGVDAVLQDLLHCLQQAIFAGALFWQREVQQGGQFVWRVVLNEHASRAFAFLLQAVAFWLHSGIVVCSANEGDDEILHRGEKLPLSSVKIF